MKRVLLVLACAVLTAVLFPGPAAAAWDEYEERFDTEKVEEALPDSAAELMDGASISPGTDYSGLLDRILEKGLAASKELLRAALKSALLILMAATLCGVASVLYTPSVGGTDYVQLAGVLAVAAVSAGDIHSCIGLGRSLVAELNDFSKVLLPTLTATAAMSGAVSSAAARYAAAALFMDILLTCVEQILIPVIYAYVAAVIADCAIGGEGLSGAASLLKWLATSLLTVIMLAFVVYLSASGLVSGSADAATVRVAKTAISTTLPVVGSIISDAANTVLMGASVIKSSVGVFGLLAVVATCLLPVIRLACHYLSYKFASRLAAALSGGRIARAAGGVGGAFGMVMGAVGACGLMLFFSIFSFIQAVV